MNILLTPKSLPMPVSVLVKPATKLNLLLGNEEHHIGTDDTG